MSNSTRTVQDRPLQRPESTKRRFLALTGILISTLLLLSGCKSFEANSITLDGWPSGNLREVGIGYFETTGSGIRLSTRRNLNDALSFALKEAGYRVIEAEEVRTLLAGAGLPTDRALDKNEILQFNTRFGGKLLLQGRLDQRKLEDITEDNYLAMLDVTIHDMQSGTELGVVKIFGKKLPYVTGREMLKMSRILTEELEKMVSSTGHTPG